MKKERDSTKIQSQYQYKLCKGSYKNYIVTNYTNYINMIQNIVSNHMDSINVMLKNGNFRKNKLPKR